MSTIEITLPRKRGAGEPPSFVVATEHLNPQQLKIVRDYLPLDRQNRPVLRGLNDSPRSGECMIQDGEGVLHPVTFAFEPPSSIPEDAIAMIDLWGATYEKARQRVLRRVQKAGQPRADAAAQGKTRKPRARKATAGQASGEEQQANPAGATSAAVTEASSAGGDQKHEVQEAQRTAQPAHPQTEDQRPMDGDHRAEDGGVGDWTATVDADLGAHDASAAGPERGEEPDGGAGAGMDLPPGWPDDVSAAPGAAGSASSSASPEEASAAGQPDAATKPAGRKAPKRAGRTRGAGQASAGHPSAGDQSTPGAQGEENGEPGQGVNAAREVDQQPAGQPAGLVAAEQPAFVPDDVDDMVRKLPTLAELEVYMPPSAAQVSDADLDGGPTLRLLLPDGTVQRRAAVVAIRTFDQKGILLRDLRDDIRAAFGEEAVERASEFEDIGLRIDQALQLVQTTHADMLVLAKAHGQRGRRRTPQVAAPTMDAVCDLVRRIRVDLDASAANARRLRAHLDQHPGWVTRFIEGAESIQEALHALRESGDLTRWHTLFARWAEAVGATQTESLDQTQQRGLFDDGGHERLHKSVERQVQRAREWNDLLKDHWWAAVGGLAVATLIN
ncbi:MAG: hypothetical protein C0460_16720 [Methylibium sp.]|nr:hypothetical protein [Methylibium sp.]